jgi:UDP-N-acetyl-D-glucosamine dehydrogenase
VTAHTAIVGLGYVGLPLAIALARRGHHAHGYDIDPSKTEAVRTGRSPVDTVTDDDLQETKACITASTDPRVLAECSTIVVCTPTPVTDHGLPDLRPLTTAVETVRDHLRPHQLVIVESTTYPSTTDSLLRPILEGSGLTAGRDFFLAYSPERIDPGNPHHTLTTTPRVVGGLTAECTNRAVAFYEQFTMVYRVKGLREAEASKILENTYRQVNIALVNEFAQLCHAMNVDVWNVLDAAATKPFGFAAFRPSSGVGGHCIPTDPRYLTFHAATLGLCFRMAETAHEINVAMPDWVARRACTDLDDAGIPPGRAHVLLLGASYKPNIRDTRNTPAIPIALALADRGVTVSFHDPHVGELTGMGQRLRRVDDLASALRAADLTVVLQRHDCYTDSVLTEGKRIFDTTGTLRCSGVFTL